MIAYIFWIEKQAETTLKQNFKVGDRKSPTGAGLGQFLTAYDSHCHLKRICIDAFNNRHDFLECYDIVSKRLDKVYSRSKIIIG